MADEPQTLTPEAAQAQVTTLRADRGFGEKWNSADATVRETARAEMTRLTQIAYPDAPPVDDSQSSGRVAASPSTGLTADAEAARTAVDAMKADKIFMLKWHAGDKAARAELAAAIEKAHPGFTNDDQPVGETGIAVDAADQLPKSAVDYHFDYSTVSGTLDAKLDSEFRDMAFAAQLPEAIAKYAFTAWNKTMAEIQRTGKAPTEAYVKLQAESTEVKLRARWGADYDKNLDLARSVIRSLPDAQRSRAAHLFAVSGLSNDELFVVQLAGLAERRAKAKA